MSKKKFSLLAIGMIIAFITKLNSPNVVTIKGIDNNTKIGFKDALSRLINMAANNASITPSTFANENR